MIYLLIVFEQWIKQLNVKEVINPLENVLTKIL